MWALDSGAFTELSTHSKWTVSPEVYAKEVERFSEEIGNMTFCTIQDWMCEPFMLRKTGLTVKQHQQFTTENWVELMSLSPDLPWLPVLQGWKPHEYLEHLELYEKYGLDLAEKPYMGVGSVCKRQHLDEIQSVFQSLHPYIRSHGFGVKTQGLQKYGHLLESSDSMSWSFTARRQKLRLLGCTTHINCANCLKFALLWRAELLETL